MSCFHINRPSAEALHNAIQYCLNCRRMSNRKIERKKNVVPNINNNNTPWPFSEPKVVFFFFFF